MYCHTVRMNTCVLSLVGEKLSIVTVMDTMYCSPVRENGYCHPVKENVCVLSNWNGLQMHFCEIPH